MILLSSMGEFLTYITSPGANEQRVWGYCRVSTEKQEEGQSPEVQQSDIQAYCARNDLGAPILVMETGSAGKPLLSVDLPGSKASDIGKVAPRPLLLALLHFVVDVTRPDKTHLVLWKLDRLARIATEQDLLLNLLQKHRVQVHSTVNGEQHLLDFSKDPGDPSRRLMRTILGATAEYERALITMRTQAGIRMKVAKGGWRGGQVPYGYEYFNKDLRVNAVRADGAAHLFLREARGESMERIAAALKKDAPHEYWHKNKVRRVLIAKDLYRGVYKDSYGGTHSRPDLRVLPDSWDDDMVKHDIAEGLGYVAQET